MNNKSLDYDEFLNWRVRMKTNISSKVEGTIKDFQGSTLVLSDVIISYNTGRNRYLSIMEIEKEEISDLSVISSSLAPSSSLTQPLPTPNVIGDLKSVFKDEGSTPDSRVCNRPEKNEKPLVEIIYTSKKSQADSAKDTTGKSLQNNAPWIDTSASQVNQKEFEIQSNLRKFDKDKEIERPNVSQVELNSNIKERESVIHRNPSRNAKIHEDESNPKYFSSTYDPSSLIKDTCIKHNILLSTIFELGGKELASLIFQHLETSISRKIFFVLGSTFYSEFALSSLKHLTNRNYRIFSQIPKSSKGDVNFSVKVSEIFSQLGVVHNQGPYSFEDFDLIVVCSGRDKEIRPIFNNLKQDSAPWENNTKLILLGANSSVSPGSITEVLFFGLVEDATSRFSKSSGRLIDIGLPKDIYSELGINYPFNNDSFNIPISL